MNHGGTCVGDKRMLIQVGEMNMPSGNAWGRQKNPCGIEEMPCAKGMCVRDKRVHIRVGK